MKQELAREFRTVNGKMVAVRTEITPIEKAGLRAYFSVKPWTKIPDRQKARSVVLAAFNSLNHNK